MTTITKNFCRALLVGTAFIAYFSLSRLYADDLYSGPTQISSQTYLSTHPVYANIAARTNAWNCAGFDNEKGNGFHLNGYFQTHGPSNLLKRYFLMQDRDAIVVSNTHANRDIRPEWLGLPNTFGGKFTMQPEQTQSGFEIEYRRSLKGLLDIDFLKNMWVAASLPIVFIKNNLHFSQSTITNQAAPTNTVYDIVTAFINPAWNYQKIHTTSESKVRPAELRLMLGKTFLDDQRMLLVSYSGLSLPTQSTQDNRHIFAAIPGYNGHVGFIWGVHMQAPLTGFKSHALCAFFLDLENTWLIRNHQYRTFDLKNKEWSRYLLLRRSGQTANETTPGVNVLTQYVRLSPYNIVDVAGGLRCSFKRVQVEAGFGLWAHGGERAKLYYPWQEVYGIAGTLTNTSASGSTIRDQAANDATFTTIKKNDIDFTSGTAPATLNWRIHTNLAAQLREEEGSAFLGAGFFAEFPHNKTKSFEQWGLFVTVGGAF